MRSGLTRFLPRTSVYGALPRAFVRADLAVGVGDWLVVEA